MKDIFVVICIAAFCLSLYTSDGFGSRRVRVASMKFSPDGTQLLVSTMAARERLWGLLNRWRQSKDFTSVSRTIARIGTHNGQVEAVLDSVVTKGGRYTRAANAFETVKPKLAFLPDNQVAFLDFHDGKLRATGDNNRPELNDSYSDFDVSSDGRAWILISDQETTLVHYDSALTEAPNHQERFDQSGISPRLSPDGERYFMFVDAITGTSLVADSRTNQKLVTIPCGNLGSRSVHWLSDDLVLIGTNDLSIHDIWDDACTTVVRGIDGDLKAQANGLFLATSAVGSNTVVGYKRKSNEVVILDEQLIERRSITYQGKVESLAVSHDGQSIAVGGDNVISMFDRSGKLLWTKKPPSRYRPHIIFHFVVLFVFARIYNWFVASRSAVKARCTT